MRRILVNHARDRAARKRGGNPERVSLSLVESPSGRPDVELIALEDALQRLATLDERKSKVVELKFFGGLTIEEIAEVLQISGATVEREWAFARAWLYDAIEGSGGPAVNSDRFQRCEELFHAAVALPGEQRDAFLQRRCADDPPLRAEVERLLAAHARAGDFISSPAIASGGTVERCRPELGRAARRAVPGRPRDRPGRDGRRLPRRARRRPVRAAGRAQGHQARHGHRAGARPLPGRAPDPRLAGPPQHRPPARRREHGPGRALLRHGVHRGGADRCLVYSAGALGRGSAPPVPPGLRRGGLRPPEPGRPPRHQAAQHPGDGGRGAEAAGLRHRQGAARGRARRSRPR